MNKSILKKMISNLALRMKSSLEFGSERRGFRVLNYHSITDDFVETDYYQMTTPKELFAEQMRFLNKERYAIASCDDIIDWMRDGRSMKPKTVLITLDDGFKDNLTNAAPILEKYGFKATIFLTIDFVGKDKRFLNWNDIGTLANIGLFSFGSHSVSHRRMDILNAKELEEEVGSSKATLEDRLKRPVRFFAYPFGCYGSFDKNNRAMLEAKGYKAAFTTIIGYNTLKTDPYAIRRTRISWYDNMSEFSKELIGAYDWYQLWQRLKRTP